MKRVVCLLRVTLGMLFLTPPVGATDGKYRQLSSDQTQASYQRKSITYLGMDCGSGVDVDLPVKQAIESALRRHIEIARFDYNEVKGTGAMSMEQLARQLRDYVKQRAVQRAASEAEYDPRFKSARVYSFDVERVMKSAYLYTVRLTLFRAGKYTCPGNVLLAAANACVPGEAGMKVKLNATVTFYHLNLDNDSQPAWTVVKELRADPAEAFFAYPTAPTSSGRQAREESRRELEEYKKALSDMDGYTTARAASKAADELGRWLAKEMKKLPAFQLLSPVVGVTGDEVEFMLGRQAGVSLDATYDVLEFDPSGRAHHLGYVKVRKVGSARGTGEGTPSVAEKIREKRRLAGGELLREHPLVGLGVGVYGVYELSFLDLLSSGGGTNGYPGVGFFVDWDVANLIDVAEVYFTFGGDVLFPGEAQWGEQIVLVHLLAGARKKWYAGPLVFSAGLRGGVAIYSADESHRGSPPLGFGADVLLGLEFYLVPEFSLFLKGTGRYFTNPLLQEDGSGSDSEVGLQFSAGILLCF